MLALKTRVSSDSTVPIADSPQVLSEGLKTDEEDYAGNRRGAGAAEGIGYAEPVDLGAPLVSTGLLHLKSAGAAPAVVEVEAEAGAGVADGSTRLPELKAVSEVVVVVMGEGVGREDHEEFLALSASESTDGNTTRMSSFCLPSSRSGASGVGGAKGGMDGRGDDVHDGDDGGRLEVESDATVAAAGSAGVSADTASGAVAAAAAAVTASFKGTGYGGERVAEKAGHDGTQAVAPGDGCSILERRSLLLNAYREPDYHDLGDLEDWPGVPGLQLEGGRGAVGIGSRFQVMLYRRSVLSVGCTVRKTPASFFWGNRRDVDRPVWPVRVTVAPAPIFRLGVVFGCLSSGVVQVGLCRGWLVSGWVVFLQRLRLHRLLCDAVRRQRTM